MNSYIKPLKTSCLAYGSCRNAASTYVTMQDFITFAKNHGIELLGEGPCQFCGSGVSKGVIECHENVHHLSELLDFKNPEHLQTRFLSVDALALQHCELHGPWNNHIHLARLFLIFSNSITWNYSKTPLLSNIVNNYKKTRSEFLTPPAPKQRGHITTWDLLQCTTSTELIAKVREWAMAVFQAFSHHHNTVSTIAGMYIDKYHF